VFTCGFTPPLPNKVCTISAGMAKINFLEGLGLSNSKCYNRIVSGWLGKSRSLGGDAILTAPSLTNSGDCVGALQTVDNLSKGYKNDGKRD